MSDDPYTSIDGGNERLSPIEARIKHASDFIRPSVGLRSRIIISANQTTEHRLRDKKLSLGMMLITVCLLTVTCVAKVNYSKWTTLVGDNADYEIYQRSEQLRKQQPMPLETSFAEAFQQIRADVSKKFAASRAY
jgi:hypothetical protein